VPQLQRSARQRAKQTLERLNRETRRLNARKKAVPSAGRELHPAAALAEPARCNWARGPRQASGPRPERRAIARSAPWRKRAAEGRSVPLGPRPGRVTPDTAAREASREQAPAQAKTKNRGPPKCQARIGTASRPKPRRFGDLLRSAKGADLFRRWSMPSRAAGYGKAALAGALGGPELQAPLDESLARITCGDLVRFYDEKRGDAPKAPALLPIFVHGARSGFGARGFAMTGLVFPTRARTATGRLKPGQGLVCGVVTLGLGRFLVLRRCASAGRRIRLSQRKTPRLRARRRDPETAREKPRQPVFAAYSAAKGCRKRPAREGRNAPPSAGQRRARDQGRLQSRRRISRPRAGARAADEAASRSSPRSKPKIRRSRKKPRRAMEIRRCTAKPELGGNSVTAWTLTAGQRPPPAPASEGPAPPIKRSPCDARRGLKRTEGGEKTRQRRLRRNRDGTHPAGTKERARRQPISPTIEERRKKRAGDLAPK